MAILSLIVSSCERYISSEKLKQIKKEKKKELENSIYTVGAGIIRTPRVFQCKQVIQN